MPEYMVTVPYEEKEIGKPAKERTANLNIAAANPIEAATKAIEDFQATVKNPLASWSIRIDQDGVNALEMETGKMFRLSDTEKVEEPKKEEEKLLSMEEYLRQIEMDPSEQLSIYKKALAAALVDDPLQKQLDRLLALAAEATQVEAGAVLLLDSKANELYFSSTVGPKADEVMGFRVKVGQGLAGSCAQTGQTVAVSDVKKDPRFFKEIAEAVGYETRSILATPLWHAGTIYGVLELINQVPDDRFTGSDIETARHLACYLALFVAAESKS